METHNKIHIGCGQTILPGWSNYDNSPSVRLARLRWLPGVMRRLGLVSRASSDFIGMARSGGIRYCNAAKRIPQTDGVVDAIYTSHMLEHLSRVQARRFLSECMRVLRPGGELRISVPSLAVLCRNYADMGDADRFFASLHVEARPIEGVLDLLRLWWAGHRHHQWMYDGPSLARLLESCGFVRVRVVTQGETSLDLMAGVDLTERAEESVYVECLKAL